MINNIPNNLGNMKNTAINITNIKNIPIAVNSVMGLIPKSQVYHTNSESNPS